MDARMGFKKSRGGAKAGEKIASRVQNRRNRINQNTPNGVTAYSLEGSHPHCGWLSIADILAGASVSQGVLSPDKKQMSSSRSRWFRKGGHPSGR